MNSKQIIGLIVAAAVFVFVAGSSVFVNSISSKATEKALLSGTYGLPSSSYVGVINISGAISDVGSSTAFQTVQYDHQLTLNLIDEYMNSSSNKGILLELDTPGGGVYESDEVYQKLMKYKETTGRPIWAYMKSQACSGGYYIAMAADKISANRNCWTGSIGVIISLTNYKELFDKVGIKEINVTSGSNKSMGSPGETLTDEQNIILQGMVDESYQQFLEVVSEGRNIPVNTLKPIADGRIYTAQQALDKNLIDEIGDIEDFKNEISDQLGGNVNFYSYSSGYSWFSSFMSAIPEKPRSDMEVLNDMMEKQGSEVPMYYAYTGK